MIENTDYELIPDGDENWHIRIKSGDFIETVIQFGALKLQEDGEYMTFNYDLVSSPIDELKEDDLDLQLVVKEILISVLANIEEREAAAQHKAIQG